MLLKRFLDLSSSSYEFRRELVGGFDGKLRIGRTDCGGE